MLPGKPLQPSQDPLDGLSSNVIDRYLALNLIMSDLDPGWQSLSMQVELAFHIPPSCSNMPVSG